MKKVLFLLSIVVVMVVMVSGANAQSKLIHYWHFNNYNKNQYTDTMRPINANYSSIDTNKALIVFNRMTGVSASYIARVDSYSAPAAELDTFNARMGAPSGISMRVRNPSDSMQLLFFMPTNRYKNIALKYGSERSNNGMLEQAFDYSVDSGTTWRTSGMSIMTDSPRVVFKLTTVTFSDTTVYNNSKFVFRIRFNGNDTGSQGNNRFDNVTLEGDTMLLTASIPNVSSEDFNLFPNPAGDMITIRTMNGGTSQIVITDLTGRVVTTVKDAGNSTPVSIATLESGMYFVTVTDESGNSATRKLIKQ